LKRAPDRIKSPKKPSVPMEEATMRLTQQHLVGAIAALDYFNIY
jgi:hypothetical protein